MNSLLRLSVAVVLWFAFIGTAIAQQGPAVNVEEAFKKGNAFMEQEKPCEALAEYRKVLAATDSEGALYNGGLAAFLCGDFKSAQEYWQKLKTISPDDWQVRTKLVQTDQALGDLKARDQERDALFEMRKNGASEELKKREFYCREQMTVAGRRVIVFEYFEMKGDRAVRYSFDVLDDNGKEDYRISLGSYELTNSIWAELNKELAAKGQRLFHLDGYYKWGHATYGMYTPEPNYDKVRELVINVLTGKLNPTSTSVMGSQKKDDKK